jgi:hypothetical protein
VDRHAEMDVVPVGGWEGEGGAAHGGNTRPSPQLQDIRHVCFH